MINQKTVDSVFSKGPRKGQIKTERKIHTCNENEVDWFDVVDIRTLQ